jgi:hypothetical protein
MSKILALLSRGHTRDTAKYRDALSFAVAAVALLLSWPAYAATLWLMITSIAVCLVNSALAQTVAPPIDAPIIAPAPATIASPPHPTALKQAPTIVVTPPPTPDVKQALGVGNVDCVASVVLKGNDNTACGTGALSNTTGNFNAAFGFAALRANTTASGNTASGFQALQANTTGLYNTADGFQALLANTTGYYNTASGFQALDANTTGIWNAASGMAAL